MNTVLQININRTAGPAVEKPAVANELLTKIRLLLDGESFNVEDSTYIVEGVVIRD